MKKKGLIILLFLLLVTGCAKQNVTGNVVKDANVLGEFTLSDVESHNNKDDCWVILHDQVYDITKFNAMGRHRPLDDWCGKDITEVFETRPMGSGTPHSQNARSLAESFLIGNLKK